MPPSPKGALVSFANQPEKDYFIVFLIPEFYDIF